jgi:hypothetical protein
VRIVDDAADFLGRPSALEEVPFRRYIRFCYIKPVTDLESAQSIPVGGMSERSHGFLEVFHELMCLERRSYMFSVSHFSFSRAEQLYS